MERRIAQVGVNNTNPSKRHLLRVGRAARRHAHSVLARVLDLHRVTWRGAQTPWPGDFAAKPCARGARGRVHGWPASGGIRDHAV
eukprot:4694191-Alexandrium_andersonii.AAC.1